MIYFVLSLRHLPPIQISIDRRNGKEYQSIYVRTLAYICLNSYLELFYVRSEDGSFTKIVPLNIGDN
jgi:hypothetical protein